ncbi:MAG: tetratricopeptide (TPR) repeat protein [Patiriisocius sp.]|jgi:tetratricopeptide (TPR) repeat protein
MAIQLVEGQTFAADYLLLHKLDGSASWLANYEPTHERVRISLLETSAALENVQQDIDRFQALVHPNLLRTYRVSEFEGQVFVVSEYKKGLAPLDLSRSFTELWPELKSIITAVQYAHSLGFHHGRMTPDRLLIDNQGTPYLDGFGLPASPNSEQYLAPETLGDNPHFATPADIYSIAQILHKLLTGDVWMEAGNSHSTPLDEGVQHLLLAMLAKNSNERPNEFASLTNLLDEAGDQNNQKLSATNFDRVAAPAPAATDLTSPVPVHTSPRDRTGISMPSVVVGLAVLLVIAAGLFLLLPDSDTTRSLAPQNPTVNHQAIPEAKNTQPLTGKPAVIAPLELAKLEELRKLGRNQAAELLRLQVAVEDVGGRLWAGDRYDQSTELGIKGDEAYREEQLQVAVDRYTDGIALLTEVLAETEQVFSENLNLGIDALDIGDYEAATAAYKIITRIEPTDAALKAGLTRAMNLQQVLRLTEDAGVIERNGNLQDALTAFKDAAALDPLWQAAGEGVARINNRLARNRFQDEMSTGFNLLSERDYDAATEAFGRAQKILPKSKEPFDGLQQIELAKTQNTIMDLSDQVEALEAAGSWQKAIPVFEQILTISPGLSSAVQGLARVSDRAELKETLDKYLSQPHLMQNDSDLADARTALLKAAQLDLDILKPTIQDLSHLVSQARITVDVLLKSDNRTDVTVYKVRQYGKISEARLSLIPGVYTFVGKRTGYRDVYQEVNIKGDVSLIRVNISCTEKI